MQTIQKFSSWFSKQKLAGKVAIGCVSLFVLCCLCSIPIAILNPSGSNPEIAQATNAADVASIQTASVETVVAQVTQNSPTNTPKPSNTPKPTNTPQPTNTPLPPTSTPSPIILTGNGDSIVDFENPFNLAIVHITGNASSRHFAVKNYDGNGNYLDLLVNTTDPYDGIRPLDFGNNEHTTRFEVKAVGEWKIEILPLTSARVLNVPGSIEGKGDEVLILRGGKPDLAKIKGNASSRHFAIKAYGNYADLLVNTTDPYEGTVIVRSDTVVIEIKAEGNWSIEITSK